MIGRDYCKYIIMCEMYLCDILSIWFLYNMDRLGDERFYMF